MGRAPSMGRALGSTGRVFQEAFGGLPGVEIGHRITRWKRL